MRPSVLFAVLLALPFGASAQTSRDSAHAKALQPSIDSLVKFAKTTSAPAYVKRAVTKIVAAEATLVKPSAPAPVPVPTPTPAPVPTPTPTPPSTGGGVAELPRVSVSTAMPAAPAVGGVIRTATSSATLQAALNAALPGDVVEIANGVIYTGNFILPNKNTTSTAWITIRPASMAGVPSEGTRMSAAAAIGAQLPLLLSPNNLGAIETANGAHHYRLVALEVSVSPTIANTGLVRLGSTYETTVAGLAHDIVLDRMYIHGTPTGEVRRGVALNSGATAIVDSYLSDFHQHGYDSQAIAGWNGSGPYKIENNYLEAASENVMFGGADPAIPGLVPSDITIRRNYIAKPAVWIGQQWQVKNLLEIKNAERVLIEGNVFENSWAEAQSGNVMNFKSVNQEGTCPQTCRTRDVTVRLNRISSVGTGFVMMAKDQGAVTPLARVTITDNLITGLGAFPGDGRALLVGGDVIDVLVSHNTILAPPSSALYFSGPQATPPVRFRFTDNVVSLGAYGVKSDGNGAAGTFAAYGPTFTGNILIAPNPTTWTGYPAGNTITASVAFNPDWSHAGTAGANVAAVLAATAGVVVP